MQEGKPSTNTSALGEPSHDAWMLRGTQWHAAGEPEQALAAFEQALALEPHNANTASACATLLGLLDRPVAAYKALLSVESLLLENADGAANLAITAEACGDLAKAQAGYNRALGLEPNHVRSLTNVAFLAAAVSNWEIAIALAEKCVALEPAHAPHHANLAEYLAGARRHAEALDVVSRALATFPVHAALKIRHVMLLAFNGDLALADAKRKTLSDEERHLLHTFLLKLESAETLRPMSADKKARHALLDAGALQIYLAQACRDLQACDWRQSDKLRSILRSTLAENAGQPRDWGDMPFFGLLLGLTDKEVAQMHSESVAAMKDRLRPTVVPIVPFVPPLKSNHADARIRLGFAVQSLHHERQLLALQQLLQHHDASRFAIHIYAFTHQPDARASELLRTHAGSVNELAHMNDADAAARIRLDRLDIYIDTALDRPSRLLEIAVRRVAPLQLQAAIPVEPQKGSRQTREGREEAALPHDALILCSTVSPATLERESFALWMKALRALPDALLWLPYCGHGATSLVREAKAAGVGARRLIFSSAAGTAIPRGLATADVFLDPLHFSAASGLADALWAGVPALTCRGSGAASRVGADILQAADLPECIFENQQAYLAEVIRLGRNPDALKDLKQQVEAARSKAPLFDTASRVRQWENACATMVEKNRASPLAALDTSPFEAAPAFDGAIE